MFIYWLTSGKARRAWDSCKHVEKILNAQRDLLNLEAQGGIKKAIEDVRNAVRSKVDGAVLDSKMAELETVANRWLKPYPHASIRDNIEVVLVAVAVALGIRTFFAQPFKIPTGSMQPTLFGITHDDLRFQSNAKIPNGLTRIVDSCLRGISYYHVVAKSDGRLTRIDRPETLFPFIKRQKLVVGDETYTIWFPPDEFEKHCGLHPLQEFRKGEDIINLRVVNGDHLFVDRVSYNFRRPQRGEIIVFETKGIPEDQRYRFQIPADQFYIKRLIGLGGEALKIGDDRHVRINGEPLTAATPHFENLYSFNHTEPPRPSHYSGHVHYGGLTTANNVLNIRTNHYAVMGDNTMNSLDSRAWGDFPQESVIGKYFLVYWPILPKDSSIPGRFGWSVR